MGPNAWLNASPGGQAERRELFERRLRAHGPAVVAGRRERLSDGVRRLLAGLRAKARDGGSR